jgi:glycosyltransferase involved in cell wall biosynthesis
MALLEAMSCAKPPVIRDIDTYNWLNGGKNCLKAEEDFKSLIESLQDQDLREELGKNAQEKSKQFELNKVGDELVDVYQHLV